jgi:putative endonuclease
MRTLLVKSHSKFSGIAKKQLDYEFLRDRRVFVIMRVAMKRCAFVYLLRCSDGTIYTGWTLDVARRVKTHQQGRGARYTRARRPVTLIYQERLPSRRAAMRREIAIKQMSRARKLALAENRSNA